MMNLFKIAIRNLIRYKRRTLLTASLITIGVVFVLVFVSITGARKATVRSFALSNRPGNICMENCAREKPSAGRKWPK